MKNYTNNKGYTITELLIAIVISLLLIAAASATYISQNRSYVAQESVSEVNTQSKIAHDIINNEIKGAAFGSPDSLTMNPVNGFTNIITPVDSAGGTDAITIISGRMMGQLWPVGVTPNSGLPCPGGTVEIPLATNPVDIVYANTVNTRLNAGSSSTISIDGVDFKTIVLASPGAGVDTLTLNGPLANSYLLIDTNTNGSCDTGRPIYLLEDTTYCVDGAGNLRRIRRGANPAACTGGPGSDNDIIAENIEDLQFAYAIDAVAPFEEIDDQNGNGLFEGGDFMNGGAVADPDTISAVRVNVLAMTDRPDINYTLQGMPPANVENRAHAPVPDSLKRRWWQSIVTIRQK